MTPRQNAERARDTDAVIAAMADETRRSVLRTVVAADRSPVSIEELEQSLDADDPAGDPSGVDAAGVGRALKHVHLPKLDQTGLIAYDQSAGTVQDRTQPRDERLLTQVDIYETE